jgi:hypothetical protein
MNHFPGRRLSHEEEAHISLGNCAYQTSNCAKAQVPNDLGFNPIAGCMTKFFTFLVGQSCCSALKSWAARQRRPTKDAKIFVMHPQSRRTTNLT